MKNNEALEKLEKKISQPITDEDVIFPGVEKVISKAYGFHRDFLIPKLSNSLDIYAKRVRELQLRQRYLPAEIEVINSLRKRNPGDLMEELKNNRELPVVVLKRDEWARDQHYVGPWKLATHIARTDIGYCRQFELNIENEEPIRVVLSQIVIHPIQRYPLRILFNRFIPGRPNPIKIPVIPVNENQCNDRNLGANIEQMIKELDLWTYSEIYPPQIHLDCSHLTVKESIKLGDVEKLLPEGVYFHKKYNHRLHQSVIKLEETKLYKGKMAITKHREEEFLAKKREIELADAMKGSKTQKKRRTSKKIQNPLHRSRAID